MRHVSRSYVAIPLLVLAMASACTHAAPDGSGWVGDEKRHGDSTIAVADRTRIHLISRAGRLQAVIGRAGKGPGEFTSIGGMAARGTDSLPGNGLSRGLGCRPEAGHMDVARREGGPGVPTRA